MLEFFSNNIFAAIIIVLCNVFHGDRTKPSYDIVTACFGWAAALLLPIGMFGLMDHALDVATLCLIAALSRDYEKMLKIVFKKP